MNVPKLRFKEFDGEYQEYSIENLLNEDIKNGTQNNPGINEAKIKFINVVNLYSAVINAVSLPYINKDITKINHLLVEKGDLFYTRSSITYEGIGYCNLYNDEYTPITYDDHIMRVKILKNIAHPKYVQLASIVPSARKYFLAVAKRGTMTTIGQSELKKLMLNIPTIEEQRKVALFFEKIDGKIQLQQQKIDLLQEQKKGFLQKMFPKAGETQPEMRFDGFAGEWKECKLGEVSNIIGGGTPSTSIEEYWKGNINWYSPVEIGEEIYVYESRKKITETGLKKSSARILPIGTVLFTSRAGIGNTAILAREGCTNQGFQSIVPLKDKLDSYFIFSRTEELKRYAEINGAGSTFVEISGKQMSKMPILLPDLKEQKRIGLFFKRLDDEIILQKRKLNLIQQQKQGFMQQMFI